MAAKVSLREKHTTETRQRILDVAIDLFIAQGFAATTVDEIAAAADVSPRTFFRYFPTKEALIFHDLEARLEQLTTWIAERPADEPAFRSLLHVLCRTVDDAVDGGPERRELIVTLVRERPALQNYQRTTIHDHTERQVTTLLAERAGLPPDDLGIRVLVATMGACCDIALREWSEQGATGAFAPVFLATLRACSSAFADGVIELDPER